ncbi:MAG: hypothetical protein U1E65_13360 [Myxococcota bacterium]
MIARLTSLLRTRLGRLVMAALGLLLIGLLLANAGVDDVVRAVEKAAPSMGLVLLFEAGIIFLDGWALMLLYPTPRPTLGEFVRVTLAGYPLAALAPAGRTVAEGVKAAILARRMGSAEATVAAARIQAVLLLSNALASVPAAVIAFMTLDSKIPGWAALGNAVLMASIGLGVVLAGRGLNLGTLLGRRWGKAKTLGPEVDAVFRQKPLLPLAPLLVELLARALAAAEIAALLSAFGAVEVPRVLLSQGLFMVGTSLGDLLPAQLGATEANFVFVRDAIGLSAGEAIAIPLLLRAAQLTWAAIGLVVPLFWGKTPEPAREQQQE